MASTTHHLPFCFTKQKPGCLFRQPGYPFSGPVALRPYLPVGLPLSMKLEKKLLRCSLTIVNLMRRLFVKGGPETCFQNLAGENGWRSTEDLPVRIESRVFRTARYGLEAVAGVAR